MVHEVPDKTFFDSAIAQAGKLIVVEFYAAGDDSSQALAPAMQNMSETFQDVAFLKVDTGSSDCASIAEEHSVTGMPTVLLFKDGSVVERIEGAEEGAVKSAIENNM